MAQSTQIKLELTPAGAKSCRDLAKRMKESDQNMKTSLQKLERAFNGVSGDLGIHGENFRTLVQTVKKAQSSASTSLLELPPRLEATAKRIDAYVANRGGSGN